jgi:FAD dependent oxidoreductase TIGR03364
MTKRYDVAIAGAGILGLAHAWHLARRGLRVLVLERGAQALGATVRNFGMLWPIGQPAGERSAVARRSAELWLEVLEASGLWHARCGSLHVAYHADEEAVLRELVDAADPALGCAMLDASQALQRSPGLRADGLRAALWSPGEMCVDPRQVGAQLWRHLAGAHGVDVQFGCAVSAWQQPRVLAGGREWHAERLLVCAGDDLQTLFPEALGAAGLLRCKLQMLRAAAPRDGWCLGPMLAGGLTLRHYQAFAACPSLPQLVARFDRDLPEYGRLGIHVMVSQHGSGELTIGDSHEYGDAVAPFDDVAIDTLVLRYLAGFFAPPRLDITQRWHGSYAKHPQAPWVVLHPAAGATVVTGVGGAGMTLSFGLAERVVEGELL